MARDPTYMRVSDIAKEYHRAKETVYRDLLEIEKEPRYKDEWIYLNDGKPRLINRNIYEDYLHHKTWLQDANLRKHLRPYDPSAVMRQRGEFEVAEAQVSEEKIREVVMKILRGIVA